MSGRELAARVGPVGVWLAALAELPATDARRIAAEIESMGYGALWIGESPAHKEVFTHAGLLLAGTERLVVATGIATIWGRDAIATDCAAQTLGEAHPGRFVLGLGASHAEAGRGQGHDRPLTALREYLDVLDTKPYRGPLSARPVPRVLAALRPRMQELGRDRAAGVHTFFVPPSHTAAVRERIGPAAFLAPEQAVVVGTDPDRARGTARAHVATRLRLHNYRAHLAALGYDEADLAGSGSDRLVDDLVAHGDPDAVAERLRAHLDAGADHVAVHPLVDAAAGPAEILAALRHLAPLRTGLPDTRFRAPVTTGEPC
ncbi:TIGR03620 family F420-dependent LLM class oxidoreductase [Pseudonocardia broussonetiae]|uniref:TIGR03620 family F420-dependent LLM class oxidoreductase n=1 Tax=Pseudonocardia broussonetiae TaxID=2736640 RepID=A0A6M6JS76_9PSEU|nr:TIGR03620 family F420-dependent LLM class oxidoreductase [Pseudonocardia broussonetiae]QJY49966.1 TIGR03620 family F420-dependent LLM class oxidoreductase [Pseudonocardia broussonetiae]